MNIISAEIFTWVTIAVYLLASICGFFGVFTGRSLPRQAGCWLALGAFLCQTFFLILGFHKFLPAGLSVGAYFQLLAWFSLLCGLAAWWRLRQDALLLLSTPFCLILFLMSAPFLQLPIKMPPSLTAPFYVLHIGSLFLSLGLFLLAAIAGAIFLILEKRLKTRKIPKGVWADMPSISLLDKINSVCVLSGFPLYTIGLLAGLFWAKPVFGAVVSGDPKEIISIIIWLLLAVLFHNRLAKGWKGRKPALWIISIFLISLLSIMVINSFLPSHHSFIRN